MGAVAFWFHYLIGWLFAPSKPRIVLDEIPKEYVLDKASGKYKLIEKDSE